MKACHKLFDAEEQTGKSESIYYASLTNCSSSSRTGDEGGEVSLGWSILGDKERAKIRLEVIL